jgi:hypothetical protein
VTAMGTMGVGSSASETKMHMVWCQTLGLHAAGVHGQGEG